MSQPSERDVEILKDAMLAFNDLALKKLIGVLEDMVEEPEIRSWADAHRYVESKRDHTREFMQLLAESAAETALEKMAVPGGSK